MAEDHFLPEFYVKDFTGKLAVLIGGGTGMGRQLAAASCHVTMCDILVENMDGTNHLCKAGGLPGIVISTFKADVSDATQAIAFRDAVKDVHQTDHINLLLNNAGIAGGGSQSRVLGE